MKTLLTLSLIVWACILHSQHGMYEEIKDNEISIPSSPAFSLLGVNPEMVTRPSDLRSFKVDWRIKNYNLAPDLALEAQPFWHLYYKHKNYQDYARINGFQKILSTMSLSFCTAKIDGVNHAAYAIKVNLYTEEDMIKNQDFIRVHTDRLRSESRAIDQMIDSFMIEKNRTTDKEEMSTLSEAIQTLEFEKSMIWENATASFHEAIENFNAANWNRSMLDIAVGRVYTYNNSSFDSLNFQKAGIGIWLNGCLRAGSKGLLTGMVRFTSVRGNRNRLFGVSYTYGSNKFNFYLETVYQRIGNYFDPDADEAFDPDESFAGLYSEDLGIGWLGFNPGAPRDRYTVTYGGNFNLNRNILLNFALRTELDNRLKWTKLIPVANIICLMK